MRVILHLMFTYCGKRFFRYNLQLFKMKKYMFSLPPDSNSSETFFFNLKVKQYLSTGFPTIFPVSNSFILFIGITLVPFHFVAVETFCSAE